MVITRKSKKLRLDELLVLRQLSPDLEIAKRFIMAGRVLVAGQTIDKPATQVGDDVEVLVQERAYVSRGGLKLAGFLLDSGLGGFFSGASVLDIGSSTGGFTDCSLRNGARTVTCLDVGKGLLDWSLRQDPRIVVREETHLKDFALEAHIGFDIILADVSFNSIARLFKHIHQINHDGRALIILLIKPQFELARDLVPVGGIVVDEGDRLLVVSEVENLLEGQGYDVVASHPSRLKGTKGNQEYFMAARSRI